MKKEKIELIKKLFEDRLELDEKQRDKAAKFNLDIQLEQEKQNKKIEKFKDDLKSEAEKWNKRAEELFGKSSRDYNLICLNLIKGFEHND